MLLLKSRKAAVFSKERSPKQQHSEYLEGVDLVRLNDVLEAINRWNHGDRGTCGCGSCQLKIRNNLVNDGNRLLRNLGNADVWLAYNSADKKIYWMRNDEPKTEVADD